jgi:selenide, water dikinase
MRSDDIRLTAFSRGAGCGCKIAPQVLREILKESGGQQLYDSLLVGNETNDDAAVYDLGDGKALIATTDFFMPIVDDAFDFGRVAAANAISDVYAMGGKPILALAILGWPIDKLPASLATKVIAGAKEICAEAGIPLAGGHTIDSAEPIFGLAVNGLVNATNLKRNDKAREGDLIYLTKPLGSGILSTAQKRGVIKPDDCQELLAQLTKLNKVGEKLAALGHVTAMTDVTGFGLLGHLTEMAEGSNLSAEIMYSQVQTMRGTKNYLKENVVPDATYRNWNAYQKLVKFDADVPMPEAFQLLPDPQTNGGLLVAVDPKGEQGMKKFLSDNGLSEHASPIGRFTSRKEVLVSVKN